MRDSTYDNRVTNRVQLNIFILKEIPKTNSDLSSQTHNQKDFI